MARINFTVGYCNLHVFKFEDINGDGQQDSHLELPIPGWPITVTPPSNSIPPPGDPYWTKQTGSDGWANWDNIIMSTYTVTEGLPAGWRPTTPQTVTKEITQTGTITVTFGNQQIGNLAVFKFEDKNGNGVQDSGEDGVPNWPVCVTPPAGDTIDPPPGDPSWCKQTGSDAWANWYNISVGTYTVTEGIIAGWRNTTPPIIVTNVTVNTTTTVRFGNQQVGDLYACKFVDQDGDGKQGNGELRKSGWTMTVTPPSGYSWSYPRSKSTDSNYNGCAPWQSIPVGWYTVTEAIVSGWNPTTPTTVITEVISSTARTVLFGNQPQSYLFGHKWGENGNGNGLSGWTIHAQACDKSTPVLTTTTAPDGSYVFGPPDFHVPPQCWNVWEELKPGWIAMSPITQTINCQSPNVPVRTTTQRAPQDPIFKLFLPMIQRALGPTPPPIGPPVPCGPVNFQNRIPPYYPKGIGVDLSWQRLYVGIKGAKQVMPARIDASDPSNPKPVQDGNPIPVGRAPFGIAVNELTHEVYVANYDDNSISVIDGNTNSVVNTISLAPYGQPTYVGIYTDANKIYVPLHASGKLAVINGSTKTLIKPPLNVGSGAFGLAMDPANCRAYVSSRDAQWVSVVDICSDQVISYRINLGPAGQTPHYEPYALGIDSGLAQLYTIIHPYPDPAKGVNPEQVWTYKLPVKSPPNPTIVTWPDGGITTVERGGDQAGVGIVVNPTTHNVFVTNPADDSVSCFYGSPPPTNAKRISQSSDGRPFKTPMLLAVDPFSVPYGRVYVTNYFSPPSAGMEGAIGIINDTPDLCR